MSAPLFILASMLRENPLVNARFWLTYMNIITDYMNQTTSPSIEWIASFEAKLIAHSILNDHDTCLYICMVYIMYLEKDPIWASLVNIDTIKKMSNCRILKIWILDNQHEVSKMHLFDVRRAIVDEVYYNIHY